MLQVVDILYNILNSVETYLFYIVWETSSYNLIKY